jgi:hypothetical protein
MMNLRKGSKIEGRSCNSFKGMGVKSDNVRRSELRETPQTLSGFIA